VQSRQIENFSKEWRYLCSLTKFSNDDFKKNTRQGDDAKWRIDDHRAVYDFFCLNEKLAASSTGYTALDISKQYSSASTTEMQCNIVCDE